MHPYLPFMVLVIYALSAFTIAYVIENREIVSAWVVVKFGLTRYFVKSPVYWAVADLFQTPDGWTFSPSSARHQSGVGIWFGISARHTVLYAGCNQRGSDGYVLDGLKVPLSVVERGLFRRLAEQLVAAKAERELQAAVAL